MALDFLKPGFIGRLDARSRIILLLGVLVGLIVMVYFIAKYFSGSEGATGPSKVANAPSGLQSVPGGQLTPEYYRAIKEANRQAEQQAQITGGSAVPTLINSGEQAPTVSSDCTVLCADQSESVKYSLDNWVKQGKVTPEVASMLKQMAESNVPVSEFAAKLNELVREGKLTPEQARELLAKYEKQHTNAALQETAKVMDSLIKSGQLPLDVANELLEAKKNNSTPAEYAALLDKMVREGRISPAVAAQLLAENNREYAAEAAKNNIATIEQMAKNGEISPEIAKELIELTKNGASAEEYAAALQRAVAEGKLTPAAAAKLLAAYQSQKLGVGPGEAMKQLVQAAENQLNDAIDAQQMQAIDAHVAQGIDAALNSDIQQLVASGKMSKDVAAQLTDLAQKNVSPEEYEAAINKLVAEGKISPEDAKRLIGKYQAAYALKDLAKKNVSPEEYAAMVNKMVAEGKISAEDAQRLIADYQSSQALKELVKRNVSPEEYAAAVNKMVAEGKLSPEEAARLIKNYQSASALKELAKRNVPVSEYAAAVNQMVAEGKISPEEAKRLIAAYQKAQGMKEVESRLAALQANNATASQYAEELKRAVQAGILTPDEAAKLMQQYEAVLNSKNLAAPAAATGTAASDEFAKLQQKVQQSSGASSTQPALTAAQFSEDQSKAVEQTNLEREARIKSIMALMQGQAGQLVSAWQPISMVHKEGAPPPEKKTDAGAASVPGANGAPGSATTAATAPAGPPIVKAGSILFAVLDTTVNSDYPSTPVLATIVDGPLKGAKLLGTLMVTKGVVGQMDRISLNFTLMNLDSWPASKSVTAYAIDPDTAKTVLASSVDYHYMVRYGAMMATSFLQGYSTGITSAGTSTTGIFGTSTTHPELSPSSKFLVGLGQVGQNLGQTTQQWTTVPPTVKVDSGVGLGILFMSDVS